MQRVKVVGKQWTDDLHRWITGRPRCPKDAEGIAKLSFFNEDKNCLEVVGCIVRNNHNLTQLINPKYSYVDRYKEIKYFAYFAAENTETSETSSETRFLSHRRVVIAVEDPSQSPPITCTVDNLAAEEKIAKVEDCHVFVPCESLDFNKSKFIRNYSKFVNMDQILSPSLTSFEEDKRFYCIGKEEDRFALICLELKTDKKLDNRFVVNDEVYDKLVDGPLFLDDKITLLGCCTKDERSRKITIHTFGKKEPIDVWKASFHHDQSALTESCEGSSNSSKMSNQEEFKNLLSPDQNAIKPCSSDEAITGNGRDKDREASDDEVCGGSDKEKSCGKKGDLLLVSLDSQASNNYQNDPARRNMPIERYESLISNDHLHTEEEGTPGTGMIPRDLRKVTLCDLCQRDSTVIQDVSLSLDARSKKRNLRNVLSLAKELSAHPVIIRKCDSNYDHSPALELFKLPNVSMLNVQRLVDSLKSMERTDVAEMIENKVLETGDMSDMLKTVDVVLLVGNMHEFLEEVTLELDKSSSFDWRRLGKQLGVEDRVLDHIETGSNPAERCLVEHAYHVLPRRDLQLSQLYQHMKTLGREDEISILFGKYGISKDDKRSMKDVFKPNSKAMEDLCLLLNVKGHCKGWQHLAVLWEITPEIYFSFIPDTTASPTMILLEWLMMAHPEFTVFQLLKHLRELQCNDVCEVLEKKLVQADSGAMPINGS